MGPCRVDLLHRNREAASTGLRLLGNRPSTTAGKGNPTGPDNHFSTVRVDVRPTEPHDFGTPQPAQC
jgi:hypothetical protein